MLIWILLWLVAMAFVLGVIFGAPYLPTRQKQSIAAIKLLGLKKGQTVVDLGSGDGSFLIEAAKQGIRGMGYEINPLLVLYSRFATARYSKLITIKWANFWYQDLSKFDGVYVFLIGRYMKKLDKKLTNELKKGSKVASYTFKIPGRKVKREEQGVYLYQYN